MLKDAISEATISEAADLVQALSLLEKHRFSILLLDIGLPGSNRLGMLRVIKELCPDLPIIGIGSQPEHQYAQWCKCAGAAAYVNLDNAPELLAQKIINVLAFEVND